MIPSMMLALLFDLEPSPMCFASEVRELCCPAACAVREKRMPTDGDRVLRACMAGLGCSEGESKSATAGTRCGC